MKTAWKWLAVAACGLGLLFAVNRFALVSAAEEGPEYGQAADGGDAMRKLDRIVEKLDRIVERMGRAPRHDGPPHDGPPPRRPHPHDGYEGYGSEDGPGWDRQRWGGPPERPRHEMPPEVREMMEQRMREGRARMEEARREGRERMEKAKEKFRELEERVKSLEAEVAQLKAARQG
jgi:hypothetical protein